MKLKAKVFAVAFCTVTNAANSSAQLNWSTATEQNNDYFEVQRSTDGINFTYVATVDGAGNSSSLLNYQYLDAALPYGLYYYRLKEVDFNGDNYFSNINSITISNSVPTTILPSVIEGGESFEVMVENSEHAKIHLVDITGKVYAEYSSLQDIPTSITTIGIPAGVYLIKVETENRVITKKIVVF